MRTQQPKSKDCETGEDPLHAIIRERVMRLLGQPSGPTRVQVRKLWEHRYRVNVLSIPDTMSAIVAHSYFLVTDCEGNIIEANPVITKQY